MKLVTVAFFVVGLLCNSTLAIAEGPVPFKAMMQNAGAQPVMSAMTASQDQSTTAPTPPVHRPMTKNGKIMIGAGIFMCAAGGIVVIGTGALNSWASSSHKAELYGAGTGTMAAGTILIVLGYHRRATK